MDERLAFVRRLLSLANQRHMEHPDWRWGQALFNSLVELDQDMAEKLRGTDIDPFYDTRRTPAFLHVIHNGLMNGTKIDG